MQITFSGKGRPGGAFCAVAVDGVWLGDAYGNARRFKTQTSASKAARQAAKGGTVKAATCQPYCEPGYPSDKPNSGH